MELERFGKEGWPLSDGGLALCLSSENPYQTALNTDLKEIGKEVLPKNPRNEELCGPLVLQISKVSNIAAPPSAQRTDTGPRLLRVTLTDGTTKMPVLELNSISDLSLSTLPGTKVQLLGTHKLVNGFVMLKDPKGLRVLGGRVDALAEAQETKRQLEVFKRSMLADPSDPPPPFMPFQVSEQPKLDNLKPDEQPGATKETESKKAPEKEKGKGKEQRENPPREQEGKKGEKGNMKGERGKRGEKGGEREPKPQENKGGRGGKGEERENRNEAENKRHGQKGRHDQSQQTETKTPGEAHADRGERGGRGRGGRGSGRRGGEGGDEERQGGQQDGLGSGDSVGFDPNRNDQRGRDPNGPRSVRPQDADPNRYGQRGRDPNGPQDTDPNQYGQGRRDPNGPRSGGPLGGDPNRYGNYPQGTTTSARPPLLPPPPGFPLQPAPSAGPPRGDGRGYPTGRLSGSYDRPDPNMGPMGYYRDPPDMEDFGGGGRMEGGSKEPRKGVARMVAGVSNRRDRNSNTTFGQKDVDSREFGPSQSQREGVERGGQRERQPGGHGEVGRNDRREDGSVGRRDGGMGGGDRGNRGGERGRQRGGGGSGRGHGRDGGQGRQEEKGSGEVKGGGAPQRRGVEREERERPQRARKEDRPVYRPPPKRGGPSEGAAGTSKDVPNAQ